MMTSTIRQYYTLADLVELLRVQIDPPEKLDGWAAYNLRSCRSSDPYIGLYNIIAATAQEADSLSATFIPKDDVYTEKLFKDYIWTNCWDSPVIYIDHYFLDMFEEIDDDEVLEEFSAWAARVMSWLNSTKETYELLIKAFEANKNDLMRQLTTQTNTKFNDTPQDGGDFTTDAYVSNASQSVTTTDTNTPIARLKEIEDKISEYYSAWAKEFERFVLVSAEA